MNISSKWKQEHKVSYRCSLPSPLQKRSKDYKGLHRSSASFELLSFLWLWQEESWETSCQSYKFLQFLQNPFLLFLTYSILWSSLLLFSLFIPNLCFHCFRIGRSSSFPHWCWQIWAGYWHFVIVQLITLGHDQSELSWCRCNLNCWDSLLEYWDWHYDKKTTRQLGLEPDSSEGAQEELHQCQKGT